MRAAAPGLFSTRVSTVTPRYIPVRQFSPTPIFLALLSRKRYMALHRATFKYTGIVCPQYAPGGEYGKANTDRQTAQGAEAESPTLRNHGQRGAGHGHPRERGRRQDLRADHALSRPPDPYAQIARRIPHGVAGTGPRQSAPLDRARKARGRSGRRGRAPTSRRAAQT